MKTLHETIEEVQTNKRPEYEDLRYAVLALTQIANHATYNYVHHLVNPPSEMKRNFLIKEKNMFSLALKQPPKQFLGWSYDPENPDYQRFHKMATNLVDKAIKGELPNQKNTKEAKS